MALSDSITTRPASAPFEYEKVRVKVLSLMRSGARLEIIEPQNKEAGQQDVQNQKKRKAFLPFRELSYAEDFNEADPDQIARFVQVGKELEVLLIARSASNRDELVASLAIISGDPFATEVPKWIEEKTPKIMVVRDATSPEIIYGLIQRGVEAYVQRDDWRRALGRKSGDVFFPPVAGDRMVGVIVSSNNKTRNVRLDPSAFLLGPLPSDQDRNTWERKTTRDALNLLAVSADNELRRRVAEPAIHEGVERGVPSALPFQHILVLDDEQAVAECLGEYLKSCGFEVDYCSKKAEANELIKVTDESEPQPYDAALIDINLKQDPTCGGNGHAGIRFAKDLQKVQPHCRIVLISGEDLTSEAIRQKEEIAKGLEASAFLEKPIEGTDLLTCLERIRASAPEAADELLHRLAPEENGLGKARQNQLNHQLKQELSWKEKHLRQLLQVFKEEICADCVALFRMNPDSYETDFECLVGRDVCDWAWEDYRPKLRYSPVADVCLDSRNKHLGWCDNNVWNNFGTHRYLLYCYARRLEKCQKCCHRSKGACADHNYNSMLATPVRAGAGDPLAYGLFAFCGRSDAFSLAADELKIQLAAEKAGRILAEYRERCLSEEDHPFLMTGRTACSVGHDLKNWIQTGLNLKTIRNSLNALTKDGTTEQINRLQELLQTAETQVGLALEVASGFSSLAKAQKERESNFVLGSLIDSKRGAAWQSVSKLFDELKVERIEGDDIGDCNRNAISIFARKTAMTRVFQNLLLNSAQQMELRGVLPRAVRIDVSMESRRKDDKEAQFVCLDFIDTGPGIHWHERERIFEPRFTSREDGSGMGLHVAKEETIQSGGRVELAESILGLGTRMRVSLPITLTEQK
jgi:signal transduction histidine kinase/DNA-binding response OmpR family regulator